jgi:hypothetical protein
MEGLDNSSDGKCAGRPRRFAKESFFAFSRHSVAPPPPRLPPAPNGPTEARQEALRCAPEQQGALFPSTGVTAR